MEVPATRAPGAAASPRARAAHPTASRRRPGRDEGGWRVSARAVGVLVARLDGVGLAETKAVRTVAKKAVGVLVHRAVGVC